MAPGDQKPLRTARCPKRVDSTVCRGKEIMAQAATAINPLGQSVMGPTHRPARRWLLWAVVGIGIVATIYVAVIALNWPFTRQAVIDALQERSGRSVTIGHFTRTYFPPGCVAEDIRFLRRKHKEEQPLITVHRLVLVTGYSRVLTLQERLSLVRVFDMHVLVPPSEPGEPNPIVPLTYSKSGAAIKIDRIIADGATLDFLSKTGKKPYRLIVDKLRLDGVGNNLPMAYKTLISNQLPPGKIRSTGEFGTWNPKDPGSTPLHGIYTFENANLAAFGGVSGTLLSSGSFKGVLRDIAVQGNATVPNFKVHDTSHERQLTVAYRAVVDGTTGDTRLNDVSARFNHTTAGFRGAVAKSDGTNGKTASIDFWTNNGQVEDILLLFISSDRAPMSGAFTFAGHVDIPGGPEPFLQRMKLNGDFGVAGGKFANAETERDLTRLSDSSPKHKKDSAEEPSANVLSDLKGHGSAVNGTATLSSISFTIPHAKASMHGTYGLMDYKLNLHGTLVTTGDPSQTTTGFRSLMVKVITPFFKKKRGAKMVPFKITGSYSNLDMSLDLGSGDKAER